MICFLNVLNIGSMEYIIFIIIWGLLLLGFKFCLFDYIIFYWVKNLREVVVLVCFCYIDILLLV